MIPHPPGASTPAAGPIVPPVIGVIAGGEPARQDASVYSAEELVAPVGGVTVDDPDFAVGSGETAMTAWGVARDRVDAAYRRADRLPP